MKYLILITFILIRMSHSHAQSVKNDMSIKLDFYLKKSNPVKEISLKTESVFTPKDLVISIPEKKPILPEKKILISPKIVKIPKINLIPNTKSLTIVSNDHILSIPTVPALQPINEPNILKTDVSLIDLLEISENEYKMIQALIFFEIQKKYDIAISLFMELFNTKSFGHQAQFHYAESTQFLGLREEYRHTVLKLLNEVQDKSIKTQAIKHIVKNIDAFETADLQVIDAFVSAFNINIDQNHNYLYKQAKYFISDENLSAAEKSLNQISTDSQLFHDAVLLSASISYRKGEINKAISKLEKSLPSIETDKKNVTRNSSIATLARLYFQKGQYNKSYETYLKIDRSSPLWLQSVIEQAWAQILVGDHIGAAGNMFSLHTEIFKKAYVPESYIVRSIGYLNLCQYGDALHVLTDLENRFKQIHEKLIHFQSSNSNPLLYYDLIKNWYKNSDLAEINTLPRSFIAELAIHPSFTKIQKQINRLEEENSIMDKLIIDFSNKENLVKQNIISLKNEIKSQKNQSISQDIQLKNEKRISLSEIEIQIIRNGQDRMKKMRQTFSNRFESNKESLKNTAASTIKNHFNELVESLGKFLDQEEILAYEVYSGAGEHIRYQMADGKINDRTPTALSPEDKKSYKWKFRGEVWEDEIGHYRSSLKNVCANEELAQTKGDQ